MSQPDHRAINLGLAHDATNELPPVEFEKAWDDLGKSLVGQKPAPMPEDIPPFENWETDEGWLCPCGACMDHDLHCDDCGVEPPWGCPCDECGEPRDGDDTWNEG